MFCNPSYTDRVNSITAKSRGGVTPVFGRAPLSARRRVAPQMDVPVNKGTPGVLNTGLGAIDWNSLVQAIPGVLQTGAQVYGQIEQGKYNPMATYNLPYGVTPSTAGIAWGGAINPSTQWGQTNPLSSVGSVLPYLLAAGGVLAAVMLMRR